MPSQSQHCPEESGYLKPNYCNVMNAAHLQRATRAKHRQHLRPEVVQIIVSEAEAYVEHGGRCHSRREKHFVAGCLVFQLLVRIAGQHN